MPHNVCALCIGYSSLTVVHEAGHAADDLLGGMLTGTGTGAYLHDDPTLNQIWQNDYATWKAAAFPSSTPDATLDTAADYGWTGSKGYTVRSNGEWMAQVVGGYMNRRVNVLASASTTVTDGYITQASNPTQRTALLARLDTLLAAYNT